MPNSKDKIIERSRSYINSLKPKKFIPGETYIPPSGQFFDDDDVASLVECALDMWYADGKYAKQFGRDLGH